MLLPQFAFALGKTEYKPEDSKKAVYSFLNTVQRQTDDFVEQARDEMKAAGFKTAPWNNYQRKTPETPEPVIWGVGMADRNGELKAQTGLT
jgi:hypothetical protein